MTFEQSLGHLILYVAWHVLKPQIPFLVALSGAVLGASFIWAACSSLLSHAGISFNISAADTGDAVAKKKK